MTAPAPWPLVRRVVPAPIRRQLGARRAEKRAAALRTELQALAVGSRSIIAGPWLGEVGYELLYWVPFLAWFADEFAVQPDRLLVLSRGGTQSWYAGFSGRYFDVFDQVSPAEFKRRHDERLRDAGEQKQRRLTAFEQRLLGEVEREAAGAAVLHPSTMYELLYPYWWGHVDESWVFRHARYRLLPRPTLPAGITLPDTYTAVRFYFNDCFPDTDVARAFVGRTLRELTREGSVVSLATGLRLDDHGGCDVPGQEVITLPHDLPSRSNLAVQTAVVAGARAFVGTYGGFSYLAPFHGVPATAYYATGGFSPRHLAVARAALAGVGVPDRLQVRDLAAGS